MIFPCATRLEYPDEERVTIWLPVCKDCFESNSTVKEKTQSHHLYFAVYTIYRDNTVHAMRFDNLHKQSA